MMILFNEAYQIHTVLSVFTEQKLPIKLSYKIMKILSSLEPEITFYRTRLQEVIDECAVKTENGEYVFTDNGENIQIQPDKVEEFNTRYTELQEMDIEIEDFKFTLDELEILELSPKDLFALQPFIIEEESEAIESTE